MTIWKHKSTEFIYDDLHGRTLPSDVFHYLVDIIEGSLIEIICMLLLI